MSDDVENHTVRLLQEMRSEMREMRAEVNEMRGDLTNRLDGNTLLLNLVAGMLHSHEDRLTGLERGRP